MYNDDRLYTKYYININTLIMSEISKAATLKAQKIVEISEVIDQYIDEVEYRINYHKALKAVHAQLQPHQENTFSLYFNEARSNIRKDLINNIAEYFARSQFTTMLDSLSNLNISQIIYNKLIARGTPPYKLT
jgi:hypothetical protein